MTKTILAILTIFSFQLSFAQEQEVEVLRIACTELARGVGPVANTLIVDQIYDPMRESGNPDIPTLDDFFAESVRGLTLPLEARGVFRISSGVPSEFTNEGFNDYVNSGAGTVELEIEGSFNRAHRLIYKFESASEHIRMNFDTTQLHQLMMWTGIFPDRSLRMFSCLEPYRVTQVVHSEGAIESEETTTEEVPVVK